MTTHGTDDDSPGRGANADSPGGANANSPARARTDSPGNDPVQLGRADEVMYIQERYQQEPKPPAAPAPAPSASAPSPFAALLAAAPPDAAPSRTLAALPPSRALGAARLLTALLAVALAAAFFYPAIHDALDRNARLLPLARDGKALDTSPPPTHDGKTPIAPPTTNTSAYLSIDSKPSGATVIIDGVARGSTPIIANVPCLVGAPLTIEINAANHTPWRTTITCERDLVFAIAPALTRAPRR